MGNLVYDNATSLPHLADTRHCTGCMVCVDACMKDALTCFVGEDGHYYIRFNEKRCISCVQCERSCPVVSNFSYDTSERYVTFAAWNQDNDQRKRSSSGGAFAALASYVIDQGGVVVGAATIGREVRHIVVRTKNELTKLQGSKYTQSDIQGCYSETFSLLHQGLMVLFSGTGCQVAGLLSFLKQRKYKGKLITVDLICGGVPSKLLQDSFFKNEPYSAKSILSYRTKEYGWKPTGFGYNMKVEDMEGKVHDYKGRRNLITDGFSTELTNRYSCYQCNFVGLNRKSDFTIGDLWGNRSLPEQHSDGLSAVIAHNDEAVSLLNKMSSYLAIRSVPAEEIIAYNHRLVDGRCPYGWFPERKYIGWLFRHCSYSTLKKIYATDFPVYSPWMLMKAMRYVMKHIF